MEQLLTVGKTNCIGIEIALVHSEDGVFDSEIGFNKRCKIVFVEEGTGILRIGDEKHLFVGPKVFCFNETDRYILQCFNDIKAEAIWFHPSILNDTLDFETIRSGSEGFTMIQRQDMFWLEIFYKRQNNLAVQLDLGPALVKRVKEIISSISYELQYQSDGYWPCRSRSYLIELLFLLTRIRDSSEHLNSIPINKDSDEIDDLLLYLNTNYMERITIEDLSKAFHVNRTTLNKRFNEVIGMPVKTYLIKLRLFLASQMLAETTIPVSEVINRVGFNDAVHFSRIFRRKFGYSPTEYRQKNCWLLRQ